MRDARLHSLAFLFAMAAALTAAEKPDAPGAKPPLQSLSAAGLPDEALEAYSTRFSKELWPLLTRNGSKSCVICHDGDGDSQMQIPDKPDEAFKRLLAEGRFDPKNASSLLARIISTDKKKRMPKPPSKPWTEVEAKALRSFGQSLHSRMPENMKMDEQFPMELLSEYLGEMPKPGPDNTFITYYQLKRKVKAIFNDDWRRNGKDLFNENIAQFGGADFKRSFNESATASATFLSGMDLLSADVAARAYATSSGPFAGRAKALGPPDKKSPDGDYRRQINQLFNRILFRDATDSELQDAWRLFQNIYREQEQLARSPQDLRFELTVSDESGLSTRVDFTIPLTSSACGLYQEFINQSRAREQAEAPSADDTDGLARQKLSREFTFNAGSDEQQFAISNTGTEGNVSIAGIELIGPLPEENKRTISVADAGAQVVGAWVLKDKPFASYEDGNEHKGSSQITLPIRVEKDGRYALTVLWRKNNGGSQKDTKKGRPSPPQRNAGSVLVEVLSHDPTRLANPPQLPVPPKGEAHFFIDQTVSNVPFTELKTTFQFGPGDGVEINNTGTRRQVVADAVYFVKEKSPKLLVRGSEAEGNAQWKPYDAGRFKPYNTVGPRLLTDDNQQKGELKLLFKPSTRGEQFKPEQFYGVQIVCPGKAGNETRAPVIVHALASSPIIQISYPQHALAGGEVTLDASAAYNLQRSNLRFAWSQTGGPKAELRSGQEAKVAFAAPVLRPQQAAWEGLCRALIKHPDFLFTRPPSVATTTDKKARQRLQLVKIAQDLVARTPTDEEFKRLEKGQPLSRFVDEYLDSKEFRDFYFHRIRLVLESHGGEEDDEPARLWSYVCFNDRSMKEILAGDYSVDAQFQRKERPPYHGKTGVLTMKGFIEGKPGLPHYNYAAMVCEKFLGYVFEVPASIVAQREGSTAATLTSPETVCYSCHKILTPLAYQRMKWTDKGEYRPADDKGKPVDATDRNLVPSYPFKGDGMEAFALQAQNKERFIRAMIQTHFTFYFGREMRHEDAERVLYKKLWDVLHANNFSIRAMLRALMNSPEYLEARPVAVRKA